MKQIEYLQVIDVFFPTYQQKTLRNETFTHFSPEYQMKAELIVPTRQKALKAFYNKERGMDMTDVFEPKPGLR